MQSKYQRAYAALQTQSLSAKQIQARYNIANPYDVVYKMRRRQGRAVFCTPQSKNPERMNYRAYDPNTAKSVFCKIFGYSAKQVKMIGVDELSKITESRRFILAA